MFGRGELGGLMWEQVLNDKDCPLHTLPAPNPPAKAKTWNHKYFTVSGSGQVTPPPHLLILVSWISAPHNNIEMIKTRLRQS